jgi:hypothetical protein
MYFVSEKLFMDHSFAYVDFGTAEAKEAAIAKSEGHLDGRRLLIKDGTYVPRDAPSGPF